MEAECCPKFDPKPWDNKTLTWRRKRFVKDKVRTFFYMPMGFGRVMVRLMGKVSAAGAASPDNVCLSDHTSRWNMDLYLAVDKKVPGAENVELSGKYLSKVYEGPFSNTGTWCEEFGSYAKAKKLTLRKQYLWYTTCPKCAKKYGKNYVVILGEIA